MNEQFVDVGPVRLCYEVLGEDCDPAVVLVMGLNLQMVWWRDDFCQDLVDRGFRVIRFDNRDAGRSSSFAGGGITMLQFLRRKADPVYTLGDMADDVAGLIAHVAPEGAHVVGASLGSFIAQETAIRHPDKVLSLTSIMGRTGDRKNGKVALSMRAGFFRSAPADLDGQAEQMVKVFHKMGSTGRTQEDDDDVRLAVRRSASRGGGGAGQMAAILAERDRTADLQRLDVPALVIHGDCDKIILPSGGRTTAAAIPGSELLVLEGMGHDLPRRLWPTILDGIARVARRSADRRAA
jgi:pimeloyl-ACP methyl ester carboxylesterase